MTPVRKLEPKFEAPVLIFEFLQYAFGFGDAKTKDHSVFSFMPVGQPCNGFKHALARFYTSIIYKFGAKFQTFDPFRYRDIVKNALLSGPTTVIPNIIFPSEIHISIRTRSGSLT